MSIIADLQEEFDARLYDNLVEKLEALVKQWEESASVSLVYLKCAEDLRPLLRKYHQLWDIKCACQGTMKNEEEGLKVRHHVDHCCFGYCERCDRSKK